MKSLIINEKRYEKGLSLIVSFCKNLTQRESRGSLVGLSWVVRESMNRRWSVDGALMEDRWSHDSAKNANMQMCKIANLHFCKSGKAHLARLAAMLLMIVTLGIGEVWGADVVWDFTTDDFISGTWENSSGTVNTAVATDGTTTLSYKASGSGDKFESSCLKTNGKTGYNSNNLDKAYFTLPKLSGTGVLSITYASNNANNMSLRNSTANTGNVVASFKGAASTKVSSSQITLDGNTTYYLTMDNGKCYLTEIRWAPSASVSTWKISVFNSSTNGDYYFIKGSGENEYVYEGFVIPSYTANGDQKQFWVGEGSYGGYSANEYFSWKRTYHQQNNSCTSNLTLGSPAGAVGTLHIWSNSTGSNYGLCFDPDGYGLCWGVPDNPWSEVAFNFVADNKWETDIVDVTADKISNYHCYVGLLKSDNHYVGGFRGEGNAYGISNDVTLSSLKHKTGSSETLTDGLVAGKGKFRIYSNSCTQNFYIHFVPYYNATFVKNNGDANEETELKSVEVTNNVTFPSPTRTGYTLEGWYDNEGLTGTKYNAGSQYGLNATTGSKTFYAKWTEAAPAPAACFSMVVKNPSSNTSESNLDLSVGKDLESLSGGSVSQNGLNGNIKDKGLRFGNNADYIAITLSGATLAQGSKIIVTYNNGTANQGVGFGPSTSAPSWTAGTNCLQSSSTGAHADQEFTVPAGSPLIGKSTFYVFRAGGNSVFLSKLSVTDCGGASSTYTITFDKDGKGTTTATQTGVPDNTATALKTIATIGWTMTGNTFAGWAETVDGAVAYTDGANITITADKTLYAKWTKNNYTVTLDNQSATTPGAASVTVTYGSKTGIASGSPVAPVDIEMPAKTGHTFGGYYTAVDGGGVKLIDEDGHFIANVNGYTDASYNWKKASNVTLYAKWTSDAPTYTVTVNDEAVECEKTLNDVAVGATVDIRNTCDVPGKHLTGYTPNTVPNYSFDAETKTLTFKMPASNVSLTAVWEADGDCVAPVITSQSENQSNIQIGKAGVTLSVTTTTPDVTYQWYRCNSEGEILQTISGATNSTYTIAAGDQHIGVYYYKCTLTHTCAEGSNYVTSGLISLQFVPADFIVNYTLKASKDSENETDLKSAATASVSQISNLSGVTLHGGLTATNNKAKSGLTAKIGNLGTAKVEDDYVTLNFHVANDYYLSVSGVNITVQPVTCNDQVYYAELEDENGTKVTGTVSNIKNGNTGNLVFTLDAEKQFKGNVTLKLWAWDPDQSGKTYRLSTSLTIEGQVHNEPIPDVVRTITFHDGVNTDTQDVPNNVATALKAMNTIGWSHTGQTFAGWAETEDGAVAYVDRANITVTEDKDLYAKWTKNQYTVTLDNQEATTAGTASVTVTYGSKTNLESPITVPTKTNNEFGGYYTAQNGAGVQVIAANGAFNKDNDYVKADGNWKFAGNVTLYAKWTSTVATYTITYDENGGTGTMTAAREYEAGETVTIKTNAFTAPSGKEFNGWVVTNNSTSATITVTAGKFTMPAAAVTITAQWQIKAATGCNTMVIYQGLTSDATGATSGSESNSGATWAVTNGSSTYETVDYTYDGVNYNRGWKIFSGASSASDRFVEIVIPENYTGTFKLVGYITSTGRSAFISTTKTGSLDKSIAYITPASTKTIVGATSAAMAAGTYYFCVTNAFQITELSVDVCPVAACTAPTINSAEASKTSVCSGTNVTLSASATANEGGALTYQWYKSDNTTAGAAGAEITVNPEETTTYYCKVTDANCSVAAKSSTVTVTVNAATAITTQPTAATEASVGETVSLKVVATGSHLSYQWQESADGSAWENMPVLNATAKQATLSVKVATVGTMYYRCVVTGDCGNETSAAASITAGAATPTVTWSDVTTVYRGEKVSVSVTTNTDAAFDESALTISAGNCTVESKTMVGKTVVAELHINTDAAANATITLTFNTAAGASYGATVNNTHTLTVSGDCPAGGAWGTVYTATMTTRTTATAIGGTVEVNANLNSGTQIRGGNTYYKFDTSSKLTLTPEGGFKVGDVLTIDITSSDSKDDGLIIKDASGTQLVDLHEKLSSSKNSLLTYTFTAATDYVTMMRHSSACYFYGAYVDRVGSLTNLEWNDTEDMIEDGVVTVAPEAENFTLAAASSNSFGTISYSLANTSLNVASINSTTGEITLQGTNLGTATVTATIAANGCYGEKSITYTLKVAADCEAPVISAHPASATYEVNTTASAMLVTATGSELTYQWYRNNENNNTSGTAISGATLASYTPDVTVRGTTCYYCEVKSGKCGTLSNVATIEVTRPACALAQPKIIEVSREGGDCWTSITLKAVEQNGATLDGGTYQWYLDGEPVSTNVQPTITVAGTYTLDYTKDECTVDASNSFVAQSINPEVGLLSPFQYYHAGKSDYSDQMNERHLFTYISLSDAEPSYTATLNEVAMAGDALTTLQGALERVSGKNNVDTIMLSLNDLVGCGFAAGDEVVITVTPKNCSGAVVLGEAKSIALHVVDARPTLAFIVSGADGAGTKKKNNFKLDGDFLTGYNKADLKVQTSATAVSEAELPLYTALKENYNVVPVNGYAPFSKWNYEPFDLTFLTDFVKTDGGSDKTKAKEKVNQLANIVDFRPLFSTKSFMSGISNWTKLGFSAQPLVPKMTQKWMNIVCYAHPMFEQFLDQDDIVKEDQGEGNYEVVFTMLSQGGFDNSKGIQGFKLSDVSAFVNIATTHYNASANIDYVNHICTPAEVGADDELLIASCERQKNIEARMIMLSVNADATSFLTEEGINVIVLSLNYLLETDPIKVTDCSFTFLGTNGTDWNTASNWNTNKVPEAKNNVRIAAPCVVGDGRHAQAASVKILKDNYSAMNDIDENGSLVISATGSLSIGGTINRIEGGQYMTLLPTHVEDVTIQSSVAGSGALIHGDEDGMIQATVEFYSKATGTDNGDGSVSNAVWQWMTTPLTASQSAAEMYYHAWMFMYSNSSQDWQPQVTDHDPFQPFVGYSITQGVPTTYSLRGTLAPTSDQTISLYSGANLIGNSWTAPIIIDQFKAADFGSGAEATIYLFNTGLDVNGDGAVNTTGDAGTYVSMPIGSASSMGSQFAVIPSMQAFQVKASGSSTVKLNYDQLVRTKNDVNIQPMRAPSRESAVNNELHNGIDERLRISVSGTRYSDFLYLFRHPATTDGSDNGWDGEKMYSDNYDIPVLYVENAAGDWQVSTQPVLNGTTFGFYKGEDTQYIIRFDDYIGDEELWLYDATTGIYTAVETGNTYSFISTNVSDAPERRFVLTGYNPNAPQNPGVATGVDDVSPSDGGPRKLILDDKMFILNNGHLYDATGRLAY